MVILLLCDIALLCNFGHNFPDCQCVCMGALVSHPEFWG